jgi:hypothetical protein
LGISYCILCKVSYCDSLNHNTHTDHIVQTKKEWYNKKVRDQSGPSNSPNYNSGKIPSEPMTAPQTQVESSSYLSLIAPLSQTSVIQEETVQISNHHEALPMAAGPKSRRTLAAPPSLATSSKSIRSSVYQASEQPIILQKASHGNSFSLKSNRQKRLRSPPVNSSPEIELMRSDFEDHMSRQKGTRGSTHTAEYCCSLECIAVSKSKIDQEQMKTCKESNRKHRHICHNCWINNQACALCS